jgi:hypothetical protein
MVAQATYDKNAHQITLLHASRTPAELPLSQNHLIGRCCGSACVTSAADVMTADATLLPANRLPARRLGDGETRMHIPVIDEDSGPLGGINARDPLGTIML